MHSNITQIIGTPATPVVIAAAGLAVAASSNARTVYIQNIGTAAIGVAITAGGEEIKTLAADTGADAGAGGDIWLYGVIGPIYLTGGTVSARVTVFS